MEKVFKALGIIIDTLSNDKGHIMCRKELDVIIQALTELKQIKEAKPSEALKCLIGLEKEIIQRDGYIMNFLKIKFDVIKQALLKAQEQEKEIDRLENQCLDVLADNIRLKNKSQEQEQVLKILKEKHLFEPTHKYIVDYSKDYATYCKLFKSYKLDEANKLTEEEFYLVRRYFK